MQLQDDLVAERGPVRVTLCVTPPAPVGDVRHAAFLAVLVEHHLAAQGLPIPEWVDEPCRTPAEPWRIDRKADEELDATTPPAFRRHGVFVDEAELVSA